MASVEPVTEHLLRRMPPPVPNSDSKDGRGRVLVVAGCTQLPGAVLLAATTAMRAGAGKLQIAVCQDLAVPIGVATPEALVVGLPQTAGGGISRACSGDLATRAGRSDAVVIGPGMIEDADSEHLVTAIVRGAGDAALVLDAGALSALHVDPGLTRGLKKPAVITPHAGEMAKLLDEKREAIEADPLAAARQASRRFGTVTVMKGGCTQVVTPDGNTRWSCVVLRGRACWACDLRVRGYASGADCRTGRSGHGTRGSSPLGCVRPRRSGSSSRASLRRDRLSRP